MFNDNLLVELAAIIIVLSSVVLDPLRDVWMKSNEVGWWKRHIVKWGQFYPPLVFICVVLIDWENWVWLVPAAIFLWQLSLRKVAKTDWQGSMWLRWLKNFG